MHIDPAIFNFAIQNTVGVGALIVCIIYAQFLMKQKEGFSFDFAFGVFLLAFVKFVERVFYGIVRAQEFFGYDAQQARMSWLIGLIACFGVAAFVYHIKTLSFHTGNPWKLYISLVILALSFVASLLWGLSR